MLCADKNYMNIFTFSAVYSLYFNKTRLTVFYDLCRIYNFANQSNDQAKQKYL